MEKRRYKTESLLNKTFGHLTTRQEAIDVYQQLLNKEDEN